VILNFKLFNTVEIKNFRETLKEAMREKGISLQKLSELTEISPNYLKALVENDIANLPSTPYIKGYINTIAQILEIDPRVLWDDYNRLSESKTSGEKDILPSNRFAQKSLNKKGLFIGIIILILIAYIAPKISDFLGKPSLEIIAPSQDKLNVSDPNFTLRGKIGNHQDKVTINSAEVVVSPDGSFEQNVTLEEGPQNTFEFKVKRFLGRETTNSRTIIYKSPATQKEENNNNNKEQSSTSTKETSTSTSTQ